MGDIDTGFHRVVGRSSWKDGALMKFTEGKLAARVVLMVGRVATGMIGIWPSKRNTGTTPGEKYNL